MKLKWFLRLLSNFIKKQTALLHHAIWKMLFLWERKILLTSNFKFRINWTIQSTFRTHIQMSQMFTFKTNIKTIAQLNVFEKMCGFDLYSVGATMRDIVAVWKSCQIPWMEIILTYKLQLVGCKCMRLCVYASENYCGFRWLW